MLDRFSLDRQRSCQPVAAMCDETPNELYSRGMALSAAGIFILSPDALLIRLIEQADAFQIVFYRMLFLGMALMLGLVFWYRWQLLTIVVDLGWRGLAAALAMAASNFGFIGAMLTTSVANTLLVLATIPLFSALFARLVLGERIRRHTGAAIAVAFAGVLIIVLGSLGRGTLIGVAIALGAAMAQGLGLALLRGAGDRDSTPTLCLAGFIAAGIALPLVASLEISAHDLAVIGLQGWLQLPLAIGLFIAGTRFAPAAEVGLIVLLETIFGPIWVWLGVGEIPAAETFVGGALVLASVGLNTGLGIYHSRR